MAHALLISSASGILLYEVQLTDRRLLFSHEKAQVASLLFTVLSLSRSTAEGTVEWVHTGHLGCSVNSAYADKGVIGLLYGESEVIAQEEMGCILETVIEVLHDLN